MRTLAPWLLLDVGNTAIKWRLADEHGLLEPGGIAADLKVLQEELRDVTWQRVAVSSVATDEFDASLCGVLEALHAAPVWLATADARCGDLINAYPKPQQLGVDRWLAMLAARAWNRGPVCVIDAGTAITIDLVSDSGQHGGGYILPGVELMRRALTTETGRIQVPALAPPTMQPGADSVACVSAGIWHAALGGVHSVLAGHPDHAPLLTGGSAGALLELGLNAESRPDLVLEGLRLWLRHKLDDSVS